MQADKEGEQCASEQVSLLNVWAMTDNRDTTVFEYFVNSSGKAQYTVMGRSRI